jgi:cell division protein ZapA
MATVSLTINGRNYDVACDDGQEDHLRSLGKMIDDRVKGLVTSVGQVGEARLLMMTGLLLADELQGGGNGTSPVAARSTGDQDVEAAAAMVEQLADQVERIAARLEDA